GEKAPEDCGKEPEFEEQLSRLREITDRLERGRPSLEESLSLYKEGMALAAGCRRILDEAEHTVHLYTEEGPREFIAADSPAPGCADGGDNAL
ncbi:MAG: exodeoxyribonuclease VII small subunit, partial [Deltaproteobacteria bacterium]|nr:exodeoxyribonuclease VII small subunit [Deltaproteobacteria bacterium]